ncbi:annexin D8-like [Malania oleifera]|uniref:annexin D8-like n=1 Tax=Malania oleifera TaxID=397392 RepID=UPI0025AEC187|nr:annexin D8-like [Malania oleifera]
MATLIVPEHPSSIEDAESIKKACQGWGRDKAAIISILGHRNAFQRKLIRLAYEEIYREDLTELLKSEVPAHFETALSHWILDPADRDAVLANEALKKAIPRYRVIVELACIRSSDELLAVKRAYQIRFRHSLEEDVASHTDGNMRRLLVAMVSPYRYDGDEIDEELAYSEASILKNEMREKSSSPEEMIRILCTRRRAHAAQLIAGHEETIRILCTRSRSQLIATFNHYQDTVGSSITKRLRGHPADEFLASLRIATRCIKNPLKYFAKVLHSAINQPRADEDTLSRVIVTRAEKDLKKIKELYLKRNKVSLEDAIAKDTSRDLKEFLLEILGSESTVYSMGNTTAKRATSTANRVSSDE